MTVERVAWAEMHPALTHLATHFTVGEWNAVGHFYSTVAMKSNGVVRGMKSSALRDAAMALARYVDLCDLWGADNDRAT